MIGLVRVATRDASNGDRLVLDEMTDAFVAKFTAKTALLVATERCSGGYSLNGPPAMASTQDGAL